LCLEPLEDRWLPSVDPVTNLSGDPNVVGSLPYEVAHAQAGDTIQFQLNSNQPATISLSGPLSVTKDITIQGPGANVLTVRGDGKDGVVGVPSGVTAAISGLTITNGGGFTLPDGSIGGGGIYNNGNLTLTGVEVANNQVTGTNTASAFGGGIFNDKSGTLTLIQSTVDHNTVHSTSTAGAGGGIANAGQMTMIDDTVADNSVSASAKNDPAFGGGIGNGGTLTLINDTVAENFISVSTSADGGGILNLGQLNLTNTIVFNPDGAATNPDISGTINTAKYSLFGSSVSAQITNNGGGNQFNTDPKLDKLQFYGGPTQTMRLLPGSPAIDAGDNGAQSSAGPNDQRGAPYTRVYKGTIDIEAVEDQPPPSGVSPAGTVVPVGSLMLFGFGFGPGGQVDLFEVDQKGQVFALAFNFANFENPDPANAQFLNTDMVMQNMTVTNAGGFPALRTCARTLVFYCFSAGFSTSRTGSDGQPGRQRPSVDAHDDRADQLNAQRLFH
jgi:hypothetical protein